MITFDLGTYRRPITTTSPDTERLCNHGLLWAYGFTHEEAVRCFEQAAELDPDCVFAHWGVAFSVGPNYNVGWDAFTEEELADVFAAAYAAGQRALAAAHGSDVERDLAGAVTARFPSPEVPDDLAARSVAYADAMAEVHRRHPDDLDVAALCADALVNLTPWQLWDRWTGEPTEGSRALEARAVCERAMRLPGGLDHPGLLHVYIHLMEMSAEPQTALPVADRLRTLVPDAGHLVHMATHLDVLCGDYRRTVTWNYRAAAVDRKYAEHAGPIDFAAVYRAHNLHFIAYGAMFLGSSHDALAACAALEAILPEELLRVETPPMADWLEAFVPMRMHVLVRFGRWEDILAASLPQDPGLYAATTATMLYAKALAYAATGRVAEAEKSQAAFRSATAAVPDTRYLFNNTVHDILAVADAMLDGEVAYRRGDHDTAFAHLRRAVRLDDGLPYDEPWGWMQPTRHALGALLLEQGRIDEAEAVYRADLGLDDSLPRVCHHPNNIWSLHGYHECLTQLGKDELAVAIGQQLTLARAYADVPVESSCFCRLDRHCHGQDDQSNRTDTSPARRA